MDSRDFAHSTVAICVGAAIVSFVGIGLYLAKSGPEQHSRYERALVGWHGAWAVVRQFDPLFDDSGECFIASRLPWSPASLTMEGRVMEFAPELGIPIDTAAFSINLTQGELRVSLPMEALGLSTMRRQIDALQMTFRINHSGIQNVTFGLKNASSDKFRRVPLTERDLATLIHEMSQGGKIYTQWTPKSRRGVIARADDKDGVATYFLPLEGFRAAVTQARTSCENALFVAAEPAIPEQLFFAPEQSEAISDMDSLTSSAQEEENAPPSKDKARKQQSQHLLGDYLPCGIVCD